MPESAAAPPAIAFEAMSVRFPNGAQAVQELDLSIPEGSFTVFVGPSGCGKTTSMRTINRLVEPTEGQVRVDGKDVRELDPVKLRRGIGYVLQHAGLLPHRTVADNIATVPILNGTPKREARSAALDLLDRVGLDQSLATRYPSQLSGGQVQRVGVARALAADPPVMLMDEPFSAVDPMVRDSLQTQVKALQAELKKTVVLVTHDIDEALLLGDRIAVFGPGGKLRQYAAPEELLTSPADEFVESFIGRDRGYRALGFDQARGVELVPIETSAEDDLGQLRLAPQAWRLVVQQSGEPLGWINDRGLRALAQGASLAESITAGGSLFRPQDSLRQALDAALSSPSGLGVAVDETGSVIGGVDPRQVLDLAEAGRREHEGHRWAGSASGLEA
ncbi:ABC transporter related protein [Segniliparus rotundus DSM 44985]|uniref:ABC-type quaternary amine transporter n=1 Tax=Segniliparus rotundus (strain ATCC BAA-972 / CDC 1076 / CIP 108378 / DSM 44985 / JCM 13578) TaxID=640132 RepID=D6ZC78_SEGRD|nr:ATP-binding cassette domain-containing protein [Segniliparus rotundus]ADG99047.1 ABC transporter related protein [Segniliparus rotundus DSM 44985]